MECFQHILKMKSGQDSLHITQQVQFLVVDHEINIRNLTKEMLESQNFTAYTAAGIIDTLTLISRLDPNKKYILLTEFKLKDGYAYDLALELCRRNLVAKYIVITAGDNRKLFDYIKEVDNSREDCKQFVDFLYKPICFKKLMQSVKKILS